MVGTAHPTKLQERAGRRWNSSLTTTGYRWISPFRNFEKRWWAQPTLQSFSPEAKELLLKYPFPGNVRELENAIERAFVLGKGEDIQPWDLSDEINNSIDECIKVIHKIQGRERLSEAIKDFEKQYITRVLEETGGNKSLAAKLLGVSRKTLWEKCKTLEIVKQ